MSKRLPTKLYVAQDNDELVWGIFSTRVLAEAYIVGRDGYWIEVMELDVPQVNLSEPDWEAPS